METTMKAVIYAIVLVIGTLCNLLTGQGGHLTPASAAIVITGAIFAGAILIIDLKFSHSRAAQLINSPTGKELEALIEAKCAAIMTPALAHIIDLLPVTSVATPAMNAAVIPSVAAPPTPGHEAIAQ